MDSSTDPQDLQDSDDKKPTAQLPQDQNTTALSDLGHDLQEVSHSSSTASISDLFLSGARQSCMGTATKPPSSSDTAPKSTAWNTALNACIDRNKKD